MCVKPDFELRRTSHEGGMSSLFLSSTRESYSLYKRLYLGKKQIIFGFSLSLHYLCRSHETATSTIYRHSGARAVYLPLLLRASSAMPVGSKRGAGIYRQSCRDKGGCESRKDVWCVDSKIHISLIPLSCRL